MLVVVPRLRCGLYTRTPLALLIRVQIVANLGAWLLLIARLVVHLLLVLAVHLLLDRQLLAELLLRRALLRMVLVQVVLRVVDRVLAGRHRVRGLAAVPRGLLLLRAGVLVRATDTCAGLGRLASAHVSLLVLVAV